LLASTASPVVELTVCFVELALFTVALEASWMTRVPSPSGNEMASMGAVFS
jgi:hypothetical protein